MSPRSRAAQAFWLATRRNSARNRRIDCGYCALFAEGFTFVLRFQPRECWFSRDCRSLPPSWCNRLLLLKNRLISSTTKYAALLRRRCTGTLNRPFQALKTSGSQTAGNLHSESTAVILQAREGNSAPLRLLRCAGPGCSCPAPTAVGVGE